MRNIFKRRHPVTAQPKPVEISPQDRQVMVWYGYTPDQWAALPALVKVDKREGWFCARGLS